MKIEIRDVQGQRFIEGHPGEPLIESADDVITLIEAAYTVNRFLLYPENLPANFFDLSSREAGAVLQKASQLPPSPGRRPHAQPQVKQPLRRVVGGRDARAVFPALR